MLNFLKSNKGKIFVGLFGLYLVSVGVSFVLFSFFQVTGGGILSPQGVGEMRTKVKVEAPKTEECPINGKMFSKAERAIWETRRPLGVMIENHLESRPQSGLSSADVVYEALAEGGVTRFMGVFYCGASAEEVRVGPVRSARVYYMDWLSEYAKFPLYAHVGGANAPNKSNATGTGGKIEMLGWRGKNDLDQFALGHPTYTRDLERLPGVALEHTMYALTDGLWGVAKKRNLTNQDEEGVEWDENFVAWKFQDGTSNKGQVGKVSYDFWSGYGDYSVSWVYDGTTNTYKRENGGVSHIDLNNKEPIAVANLVILYTKLEGPIDGLKHVLYDTVGKGKALVFQNGEAVEVVWSKESRESRTKFMLKNGTEVKFVRGPIWISVLDLSSDVNY